MKNWIFIVTDKQTDFKDYTAREIYERRMKDKFWGLGERTPNRTNLEVGDNVIFYLGNPEKTFAGKAVLASNAYQPTQVEKDSLSHGNPNVFGTEYGVRLDQIQVWDNPRYVPFLVDELSFIENKRYWGSYFQGGIRGITSDDYQTIQGYDVIEKTAEVKDVETSDEAQYFALEAHLEEFIFNNWNRVNWGKNLRLYRVEDYDGRQFPAGIWSIDFLAVEDRTNDFVVLELKRGMSSDNVVGQVLRYMGWVKENLCEDGQDVKGIVICHESDEALRLSISQLSNVDLMLYEVDFRLNLVE